MKLPSIKIFCAIDRQEGSAIGDFCCKGFMPDRITTN